MLSTIRYFRQEYEEHIHKKYCRAGVCSQLFLSPCENTCPANVNIPGYLALIATGRFQDAYDLIRQENPLPAICGRVCTHPCESKCRRGTVDEPIAICGLKRFVADYAENRPLEAVQDVVFPRNGKRVSIVGAGAAGLTCGYYLVRIGYEVDIYESLPVAGGVLAFGIPEYRLPSDVIAREVDNITREGVNLILNTEVGKDIDFKYIREQYDATFVATGTQFPQKMNVPGENLEGVIPGIEFLKRVKFHRDVDLRGKHVIVVGGGNTAIDSARTALRLGPAKVTILYRRTRDFMPAYEEEIDEALREGAELLELVSPERLVSNKRGHVAQVECVRREVSDFDSKGRRNTRHIEGSNFYIDADVVIPAVSQYADLPFIETDQIGTTSWGTFIVDQDSLMTTMEGVFAGGDVVRGPDEVIQAIADGKQAAISIDRYLGGEGKLNKGRSIEIPEVPEIDDVVMHDRFDWKMLPLEKRAGSFDEVVLGYHRLNAMAEAMRCLHCDRR